MNCETFTTTIDGNDYAYTQLPASKSLALKYKLIGLLGSTITDLVPMIGKSESEQMQAMGKVMQDVFVRNNPDEIVSLIKTIFVPAFRNKERIDIDEAYTGNQDEMYKALVWILKCEYGNFIQGLSNMLPVPEVQEKNSSSTD